MADYNSTVSSLVRAYKSGDLLIKNQITLFWLEMKSGRLPSLAEIQAHAASDTHKHNNDVMSGIFGLAAMSVVHDMRPDEALQHPELAPNVFKQMKERGGK